VVLNQIKSIDVIVYVYLNKESIHVLLILHVLIVCFTQDYKYENYITIFSAPSLDLEITSSGSDTYSQVSYGSDSSYDITIFTIPRSKILLEITRNGVSLANDKRFEIITM
jgi:hypothetical protein